MMRSRERFSLLTAALEPQRPTGGVRSQADVSNLMAFLHLEACTVTVSNELVGVDRLRAGEPVHGFSLVAENYQLSPCGACPDSSTRATCLPARWAG